jgi:hypothetical protein
MSSDFIDWTAPSLQGKLPQEPADLPRGLITPPEKVRELVEKERAKHPPEAFDRAEERLLNEWTLMSRLVIPVSGKILWSTGDVRLWTEVVLLLKDRSGRWRQRKFRVDTASDLTTMGAHEAKQLGLAMPLNATPSAAHAQTGLEIRSGYLRFRIVGMDATEYVTSTLFLGNPDTPPALSRPGTLPRKLLQPLGLLDRLCFTPDRNPASGALYGEMTVEKK